MEQQVTVTREKGTEVVVRYLELLLQQKVALQMTNVQGLNTYASSILWFLIFFQRVCWQQIDFDLESLLRQMII